MFFTKFLINTPKYIKNIYIKAFDINVFDLGVYTLFVCNANK